MNVGQRFLLQEYKFFNIKKTKVKLTKTKHSWRVIKMQFGTGVWNSLGIM
jgi:hypothetical protein